MRFPLPAPRVFAGVALAVGLLVAAGCGGTKEVKRVSVKGTVTHKGKPVTAGSVYFVSEDAPGVTGTTQLRGDGTFAADGIPLGKVKLAILTAAFKPGATTGGSQPKMNDYASKIQVGPAPKYVALPDKYEKVDTANLSYTVAEGKDLEIVLPD